MWYRGGGTVEGVVVVWHRCRILILHWSFYLLAVGVGSSSLGEGLRSN